MCTVENIDFNESVYLLLRGKGVEIATLVDAVRRVIDLKVESDRAAAAIARPHLPLMAWKDIETLSLRSDFPNDRARVAEKASEREN